MNIQIPILESNVRYQYQVNGDPDLFDPIAPFAFVWGAPLLRERVLRNGNNVHCNYNALGPKGQLAIDRVLLPEQQRKYREQYHYLGESLFLNNREPHEHPMGATDRAIAHKIMHYGMYPTSRILDVGASYSRNLITSDIDASGNLLNTPLTDRVWSTTPILCKRDEAREWDLLDKLKQKDAERLELGLMTYSSIRHSNNCRCKGGYGTGPQEGVCQCQMIRFGAVTAIDSAYYPGVIEELLKQIDRNDCTGAMSFFDYDRAYESGIREADLKESQMTFVGGKVSHKVKGNMAPYEHDRITTKGQQCYQYHDLTLRSWFLFERVWETMNGKLSYSIFKIRKLSGQMDGVVVISDLRTRVQHYEPSTVIKDTAAQALTYSSNFLTKVREFLQTEESFDLIPATKMSPARYKVRLIVSKSIWGQPKLETFEATADLVEDVVERYLFRHSVGELTRVSRALLHSLIKDNGEKEASIDNGYNMNPFDACAIAIIATILASRVGIKYARAVNNSESIATLKTSLTSKLSFPRLGWVEKALSTILALFTAWVILFFVTRVEKPPVVLGFNGSNAFNVTDDLGYIVYYSVVLVWCLFGDRIRTAISLSIPEKIRRWWPTDCLHDPRLSDLSGPFVVDPKFKVRSDIQDQFPNKWVCDSKSVIGPVRVGPLIRGFQTDRVVTQNHSCKKSDAAAIKRMVDTEIQPDPVVVENFRKFVMTHILPEMIKGLEKEELNISFDEWKQSFPLRYQDMISRERTDLDVHMLQKKAHKMHSKTDELNVAGFDQDDRESGENVIKKRAIAGPPDWEKVMVNLIFKAMSSWQKKWDKKYMVGLNFSEIAARIEEWDDIPHVIHGASDGKKFDGTQKPAFNQVFYDVLKVILSHPNCHLDHDFNLDYIFHVLDHCNILNMKAMNGALKFICEGRGSGDGWTTYANTNLSMWYTAYTMYQARVPKNMWSGGFAGDDVLFAINKYHRVSFEMWNSALFVKEDQPIRYGLGQICKKLDWGDITELDFISCNFYRTRDGGLRMTRIAGRALQTLCFSSKVPKPMGELNLHEDQITAWYDKEDIQAYMRGLLAAKAECGLAWAHGLSIFENLYHKMLELGDSHHDAAKIREYGDENKIWTCTDPDEGAYLDWFINRYKTTREEIEEFNSNVREITSCEYELRSSLIDKVMLRDCPYSLNTKNLLITI